MIFGYNIKKIREDFPILSRKVIYFDNACMSLKPKQVVDAINKYYYEYTACAGRSSHQFASHVETEVAKTRECIRKFINAKKDSEIIFTRNTTEGINLVANVYSLQKGDEVIISDKEHNSNLIPWLKLKKRGIKVVIAKSNPDNTFDLDAFTDCFTKNTKLASIGYTSNLDGATNPVKEIAKITHKNGAFLVVDAAQTAPHKEIDVKNLDADFLAFSGHKMLGPTGTGVLYGKKELLDQLDQFIVGGETVIDSQYDSYNIEEVPMRFEAGLQDYAGIIGLGEACRYLGAIGLKKIAEHEKKLNSCITESLSCDEKLVLIGPKDPAMRSGIFSFNIKGMDARNVAKILEASKNIMVRSGMHCVHSWFNSRKIDGSVRASLYLYNTEEEAQIFIDEIKKILKM